MGRRSDKYKINLSFKNKKLLIVGGIILLIFVILYLFYSSVIKLEGGNVILKYKGEYKEKGYSASLFGKDYTKKTRESVSDDSNTMPILYYKSLLLYAA